MNDLTAPERTAIAITLIITGGVLMTQAVAAGETVFLLEIIIAALLWIGGMALGTKEIITTWSDLREIKKELFLLKVIPPLFPEFG